MDQIDKSSLFLGVGALAAALTASFMMSVDQQTQQAEVEAVAPEEHTVDQQLEALPLLPKLSSKRISQLATADGAKMKAQPNRGLKRQSSLLQLNSTLEQINTVVDCVDHLSEIYEVEALKKCDHLAPLIKGTWDYFVSPLMGENIDKSIFGGAGFLPEKQFLSDEFFVTATKEYTNYKDITQSIKFVKSGPRKELFYDPAKTKVAILTCGGLCPGLNVVIRELVMSLHYNYEVSEIYGVKWGYKGLYTDVANDWIKLTPKIVKYIHKQGGTILGSSRGGFNADKMLDSLVEQGVNQVYVIGGDGTHRGINGLMKRAIERGIVISFAGIPKTIDNDIPLIDYSFGFNTSVEVASTMISAAHTEATSAHNGIGIVKLMGRYAGFIAHHASLSNNEVDFCLIPELPFELKGPNGLYEQIIKRVQAKGNCLIVVAEGAEEGLINPNEKITAVEKRDASRNLIYDDIGNFLQSAIKEYAQQEHQISINVTAIDPTYAIRSVAANGGDTKLCTHLAQHAVHGVMHGFTGFSTGMIRNSMCYIPIITMMEGGSNKVSIRSRIWQRLVALNNQPNFVNAGFVEAAEKRIIEAENKQAECIDTIQRRLNGKSCTKTVIRRQGSILGGSDD